MIVERSGGASETYQTPSLPAAGLLGFSWLMNGSVPNPPTPAIPECSTCAWRNAAAPPPARLRVPAQLLSFGLALPPHAPSAYSPVPEQENDPASLDRTQYWPSKCSLQPSLIFVVTVSFGPRTSMRS